MTIADRIRDIAEAKKLTQQELADALGASRINVNQLMNRRRGITPRTAIALERLWPNIAAIQWMYWQAEEDLVDWQSKHARARRLKGGKKKARTHAGIE